MSERTDPLSALDRDCAAAVVAGLDVQSALSLSACSKAWRELVLLHDELWRTRAASDLPPPLLQAAAAAAASGHCSWHAAYQRATRLQSLRCVAWSSKGGQQGRSVAGRQPRPREGHAACAWGARSMLVCGGFGGGILSGGDLHLLTPAKRSSSGSRGSGSSSPGAGGNGSSSSTSLRWVQPKVANRPPVHRYGHTLTRCGAAGELAVLFGGLQAGGYQAPLDTLAVLRRKGAPASGSGAAAAGASHAAGPAAAASSASGGDGNDDANSGSGSEEETSLALRLGGWQGGADGGGLQQLLWAQMFDFFAGQDDEEDEEEEEEGESEDAELWDGDSQGAGSSDEEGEDGWESASGSEYGSGEEGSDKEWLPNHSARAAAGTAARPASVVAAMARRSSSPDSPAAAGTGPDAAGVGTAATAGGLHQPVAGALGGLRATSPAAAAAGPAAVCDEDAALADEELEWYYPRVSGDPPGARGYHSTAASEDGSKLYVFGGISATGACNTLAVLDLASWEWSRPPTHGTPPSPRCGHSSVVYRNRLWVVGGGSGRDLLRSGRDLGDVHCLDLSTMEWRRLALPTGPLCAGKCHASALVGRRLLLFGGSMASCNELAWLDLEQERWGAPVRVLGPPPCERMSATAVLCGEEVVVFGGYTFNYREVGDVHRLHLLPAVADSAAASEADARDERAAARRRQRWGPWW